MRRVKAAASAAALLAAGAAGLTCSDASSPQTVGLTLALSGTSFVPGDILYGTINVEAHGRRVDWLGLQASGYVTARDSTAVNDAEGGLYGFDLQLPFQPASGSLRLVAFARSGGVLDTSTAVAIVIADAAPPTFNIAVARPLSPQADRLLRGVFWVGDNAGLVQVVVAWTGAIAGADTFALNGYPRSWQDSVARLVPVGTSPGRAVTLTITATDLAGLTTSRTLGPYSIVDSILPTLTATTNAPASAEPLLPGDTLRVTVNAADNHRLAYVGWRAGPPASAGDSVAQGAIVANAVSFARVVPLAWVGNQTLTAFARDSMGNEREAFLPGLFVVDAGRRPILLGPTISGSTGGGVRDLALDVPRGLAYFTLAGDRLIYRLSLSSLTLGTPIGTPLDPGGLDVSPDGTRLVVALRGSPFVGIVDLNALTPTVDTVRIGFDPGDGRSPDQVRIAANNRAIVTIASDSANHVPGLGRVFDVDLDTRVATLRTDAGNAGAVSPRPMLARAGNHSRVFLFYWPTCCTGAGQVYDAATDAFSASVGTGGYLDGHHFSADSTGSRLLVRTTLYNAALAILGSVFATGFTNGASALDPGGTLAHLGQDGGVPTSYATYQVPGGVRVERVMLPDPPTKLWSLPNGQALLGVIGGQFVLVDLR